MQLRDNIRKLPAVHFYNNRIKKSFNLSVRILYPWARKTAGL